MLEKPSIRIIAGDHEISLISLVFINLYVKLYWYAPVISRCLKLNEIMLSYCVLLGMFPMNLSNFAIVLLFLGISIFRSPNCTHKSSSISNGHIRNLSLGRIVILKLISSVYFF